VSTVAPPKQGGEDVARGQSDEGVDPTQYEATAEAYYQSVVGRASAARSRAQAGFAIVSAISGFVIAAAFTSQIDQAPDYTKLPAFFGVVFWILAAGSFLVASIIQPPPDPPVQPPPEPGEKPKPFRLTKFEFVNHVKTISDNEANRVSTGVIFAGAFTAIALALTMFTVAMVVFFPPGAKQTTADVTVTEPYLQQFLAQCQVTATNPTHDLVGTLDLASLNSNFVELNIEPGICANRGVLEIPRSAIVEIEEYPQCSSSDLQRVTSALSSRNFDSRSTSKIVKSTTTIMVPGLQLITSTPSPSVEPRPMIFPYCPAQPFRKILHKVIPRSKGKG
jgi:hypothetical protein